MTGQMEQEPEESLFCLKKEGTEVHKAASEHPHGFRINVHQPTLMHGGGGMMVGVQRGNGATESFFCHIFQVMISI